LFRKFTIGYVFTCLGCTPICVHDFSIEILKPWLALSYVWQIQVKAEGNTSISMFFSKKGAERKDTKPEQKLSCHESVKTEPTEDLIEGAKAEEVDKEVKFGGSSHSQNASLLPIKREYETFSADSKPALENHDQISSTPAKKKEKTKKADDKQPTLFSFFGKK